MKKVIWYYTKKVIFYGFTAVGGIGCGVFAIFQSVFQIAFGIPFWDKNFESTDLIRASHIDPNLGFHWPYVSWPWANVIVLAIISIIAWINYARVYYRD